MIQARLLLLLVWMTGMGTATRGADVFRAPGLSHMARSSSRQFTATGPLLPEALAAIRPKEGIIFLEPGSVVVSCDRIREAFRGELALGAGAKTEATGEGNIIVRLKPGPEHQVRLDAVRSSDGFSYHVELPNQIDTTRFIEVIVKALLLDQMNQAGRGNELDVPMWYVSGLASTILSRDRGILAFSVHAPVKDEFRLGDGLQTVRDQLSGTAPLSFQELSWPGYLKPDRSKIFAPCSLLLFRELGTLPEGKAKLRDFLMVALPKHKNWQVAFLETYKTNFRQLVDVEKWWALKLVEFSTRRPDRLWSRVETLAKLEDILKVPVFVRNSASDQPRHDYLTLSEVIENSDTATQEVALNRIQTELSLALRVAAPELAPLLEDYRATLEAYMGQKKPQKSGKGASNPTSLAPFRKATLQKLNSLEKVRQKESQQYVIESASAAK